ncbi:MAG TPA: secretin N-terminal domain-containing protein [Candidatus Limnocylindrales bacterium]|nr:secretin N-terminal domain-containing protein [Candidatus Limnocylindrales bacterium]
MKLTLLLALGLLGGLVASGIGGAQTTDPPARLNDVTVERSDEGAVVRLKTTGAGKYEASLIGGPNRLVIDLGSTTYAWSKTPVPSDVAPIKEIRGSQFRVGIARVVVELTRKASFRIDEHADGLVVVIESTPTAAKAEPKAEAKNAKVDGKKGTEIARNITPPVAIPAPAAKKPEGVIEPIKPAGLTAPDPRKDGAADAAPKPAAAPVEVAKPAAKPVAPAPIEVAKPVAKPAKTEPHVVAQATPPATTPAPPRPVVIGQAQVTQPSGMQSSNGGKLISLDFKEADVVNLLRILSAESGRNIVAGDDVKGKVSVSLRNVTWEQALDTILEVKGLAKIEKGGVIRVVSLDQLAKEREALARVEDAKRRSEIETRTKLAEAEMKEAELAARKVANEVAAEESKARGPLREETVRLSYADPEEVAKTLQGILGIPPEGTQAVSGSIPGGPPPIAEPPFSQLYGSQQPRPTTLVSVSQDVLAKGITIKAHKPTNTVFIRHYATDLERIKKLIREQLDVPLPQVKIEARMEILDRNALEAIGVQWGGAMAGTNNKTTLVGQGYQSAPGRVPGQILASQGGVLQADGSTVISNPVSAQENSFASNLNLSRLLPVDASTGLPTGSGNLVNLPFQLLPNAASQIPAGGIAFGIIGTSFNINLALQALASQGKTRTLARPEIVTVENAKASISLGEEIPYATVSSAGTQIQFKEALLKLDVTPTVIRERIGQEDIRKIKMVVIIENNSRGDPVNLGAGGTPPAINRRKAETQVLIREGERLVIGGVTQGTTQVTIRKVPVLGDIPLLGWLFKQRETFETGRELVVFVTPSILKTDTVAASR